MSGTASGVKVVGVIERLMLVEIDDSGGRVLVAVLVGDDG
jgi:hypothetical protein